MTAGIEPIHDQLTNARPGCQRIVGCTQLGEQVVGSLLRAAACVHRSILSKCSVGVSVTARFPADLSRVRRRQKP